MPLLPEAITTAMPALVRRLMIEAIAGEPLLQV